MSEETEAEKIVASYGKRWSLELDLRTLKCKLRSKHLQGKSNAAVEKELLIAVVAYGFVRAPMPEAAGRACPHPRQLSFTRAHGLLNAVTGQLCFPTPSTAKRPMISCWPTSAKPNYPNEAKRSPIREPYRARENTIQGDSL